MKTLILSFLFSFCYMSVYSQQPEIVVDFNAGSDDSFSEWNYKGINFQNKLILPILSNDVGEELAIIINGELSILKDINEGTESSEPKSFTIFNNELYFVANDGINGYALWRTDGTEEGTELFVDPGDQQSASPRSLIVAQNGWLYYNYNNNIYRTDGTINEQVYTGVSIGYYFKHASRNYCKYKNGIAFITKNNDYSFSLIYIDDNEAKELVKTDETSYFADAFGIAPLSIGLMFSIEGSSQHDAMYVYDETNETLKQLEVGGELIPSRRTIDFNDEINICWIEGKGYYSVNGVQNEEQLLIESNNSSATQGEDILYAKYGDKLAFIPVAGSWFEDDFLVYTDGTINGTSMIKNIQNEYLSDMIRFEKYAILVEGVSNNFKPNIVFINLETGEAEDFYTFNSNSTNINSVRPIGIQGDYLYFISNLDNEVGAELYRIKTNLMVNNIELNSINEMNLKQIGNQFTITSDSKREIEIHIYNSIGQLVIKKKVTSNLPFTINLKSGIYTLNYSTINHSNTKMVFIK